MSTGVASPLLRRINERRVLEVIQRYGAASRAVVGRALGMTAPTVSKAADSLLKQGLLEEGSPLEASVGRPGKLLQFASRTASVLGVVIDSRVGWVLSSGLDGRLIPDRMQQFDVPDTYPALLAAIEVHARKLIHDFGVDPRGIGISVPGLVRLPDNEVVFSPNMHQLDHHRPGIDLSERLGLPCVMVQESHALCLGERMYGEARGVDNFAMLDISTGLGLGVMIGGELLSGQSGLAGELGHITVDPHGIRCGCGNFGCLETVATDSALTRLVSLKVGRDIGIEETVRLIREEGLDVAEELNRTCEYLAIAVAAVINIFNPATLFVHGRLFEADGDLFQRVVNQARERALKTSFSECAIRQARGSKRQGAIAGIVHHLTAAWAPAIPRAFH